MARIDIITTRGEEKVWVVVPETEAEKKVARENEYPVGKGLSETDASLLHDRLESLARASIVV